MNLYSPEEMDLIRRHYPDVKLLLRILPGRTAGGLKAKAGEMGLRSRRPPIWTLREERLLREHYPNRARLEKLFPNRTWDAITTRAGDLGLTRRNHRWTRSRVTLLAKGTGVIPNKELASILGVSLSMVRSKQYELDLRPRRKPAAARIPMVQDILEHARANQVPMKPLTAKLGCKNLVPSMWHDTFSLRSAVVVALHLGGEIYVEWRD